MKKTGYKFEIKTTLNTEVTNRFSDKVRDYVLYRPGYPTEIIPFLESECGLQKNQIIADIGSGTGFLTRLFLEFGNTVYAVEPNDAMRRAGEEILAGFPGFRSMNGRAEETTLPDKSMDMLCAGQAFHWFDYKKTKTEFTRILKQGGFVVLVWNERPRDLSGFMGDYDQFLVENSTDYKLIDHRNVDYRILEAFYAPGNYRTAEFAYRQVFEFRGLKGRYDSCSYAIPAADDRYPETVRRLNQLFDRYQDSGTINMDYITKIYYGRMD